MSPLWLAAPALVALAVTVLNALTWSRGRPDGDRRGRRVAVLIPARDEEATIAACVRGAALQDPDAIVVYEDRSSDGTAAVLEGLRSQVPSLRVVPGVPLPAGQVGKPHACARLAEADRADLLLFVDADTVLQEGALSRLIGWMDRHDADVVTVVPRQRAETFAERLLMPLLHLTYVAWLPLPLVHRTRDPRFLAANGQVMLLRARALEAIGGFASVRSEVVDDMALCRRFKATGHRVFFGDGALVASTRMYQGAGEIWRGFSKNVFEGLGERPAALLGVVVLYLWAFVAPYVGLVVAVRVPGLWTAAVVGTAANLGIRGVLALRHGHGPVSVVLHPLAVLAAVAVALNSWRWSHSGTVAWRGRVYARRAERAVP